MANKNPYDCHECGHSLYACSCDYEPMPTHSHAPKLRLLEPVPAVSADVLIYLPDSKDHRTVSELMSILLK